MHRKTLILAVALLICGVAQAQKTSLNYSAHGAYTYVPLVDDIYTRLFESSSCGTYGFQLGFNTCPEGGSPYAQAYNYPVMGFGISWSDFGSMKFVSPSHYNGAGSIYGFWERPFHKSDHFLLGYIIRLGCGLTGDRYDPVSNPTNHFLGSNVMVYAGTGFKFRWKPAKKFEFGADATFTHYSNGKIHMPNAGLNILSLEAVATYNMEEPHYKQVREKTLSGMFTRGMFWDVSVIGGAKCLESEWFAKNVLVKDIPSKMTRFTPVMKLGVNVDAMYRYSLTCSSGVSMDVIYTGGQSLMRECDEILNGKEETAKAVYNPISVGIGGVHQFHYANLAMYLALGVYVFNKSGINEDLGFLYQKLGLRYYFPGLADTFLGFSVRSYQFCKADCLEFSIGMKMGKGHKGAN